MDQTTDLIGSSPRRVEDRRLLVGAGRYLDDMTREGLLHLGVVRSAHGHARIRAIDTREARTLPGVVAAWSAADLSEAARPILASADGAHKGRPFAARVLAGDVVRYVGECVAVVVADDPYRLADAIERVAVDYEPLPALITPEDALGSRTRLHADWPDNAAVIARGGMGDAERALASADVVVSEHFRHARLAAVFVETRGALAYRDPDSGRLVLWSSTQNPYSVRDAVARIVGVPAEEVRVLTPDVGGGFGPKGSPYPEEALVALAALRLRRPVKWVESRREDFQASGHDREQSHQVKIGFGKDGAIADIDARRLGLDPAEIRRRNLVRPAEMPYRPGLTYKDGVAIAYDPGDFPAAFERALGLLGYDDWRRRQAAQPKDATRRIGVGLACYAQGTGLGPFEGSTVRVDPSGKVYVMVGVAAQGQGHATTLAQICAQELGAAFEDVIVTAGDTTLFPFGMGTGGSRVMVNAGPAVARTARAVRERAALVASELLECAPADVRIEASRAFVTGMPDRTVPLGRLAQAAVRSRSLKATGEPGLHACTYHYPDTVTWAFGTQAAAVEVDLETAAVRLLGYAVVHDPGRAINPMIVEAQLQGGAVQAIGAGLMEAIVYAVEDAVAHLGVTVREVPVTPAYLHALLGAARAAAR